MDKLLYIVGALTALLGVLVLADNVAHLRARDETPIVLAWVGGWLLVGLGALVRAANNKG
jgi:hypothetical protein